MDSDVGARIRMLRERRRLSLRAAAELAGRSHAWLSLIERGLRQLEKRSDIDALARVLKVSQAELLGQPYPPSSQGDADAQGQMEAVRLALVSLDLAYEPEVDELQPLGHTVLAAQSARAALYRRGEVTATGRTLPGLLGQLHAHATRGPEDQRRTALEALVEACCTATSLAKVSGYHDLAWICAERGRQAAHILADPTLIGLAAFYVSYGLRPYEVATANTLRALAAMEPAAGSGPQAMQVYGMLQMMAAFGAAVVGADDDMAAHLAEADDLAARTGDTSDMELYFGPSNIAIWRLSMAVERGEGGRGLEAAADVHLDAVSRRRQFAFLLDRGRAEAQQNRDHEALRTLLDAERLMPQELHSNSFARTTIGELYRRERARAVRSDLRGLATRVGVDVS